MQIATRFHGAMEVREEDIIVLDHPILGFGEAQRFVLYPHRDSPFLFLQSVDFGPLCFIVIDPLVVVRDYQIPAQDVTDLGPPEEWAVLCLCTMDKRQITVNLRSPVVINKNTRHGGQYVLSVPYPFQFPIWQEAAVDAGVDP
ncbi:MAG: flagellar assembly protein FliW [Firmicutes bacterium]|nr:flagellar assembly protein FliW [Alicyclobacillaceae bacterium]MCL6497318.1 flagellar assembly protein FliW [Bacillota bacterium]